MKTNHQRNFKDTRDPRYVYSKGFIVFSNRRVLADGRVVAAGCTCGDHTNGKRGIAKDRKGAKKYINSRVRFHENALMRKEEY